MNRLKNKTAVITAAGQGIGLATAKLFFEQGANVIATDINADALQKLKQTHPQIETHPLDVTNAAAIQQFSERFKQIDILFNCAGFVHHGTILDCDEAAWDFSFNLNVKSMYRMIRAFIPHLQQAGGSIINIASVVSSIKGVTNRFVYGATKAAVIGLTKAIAADYVQQGIRCNAICPGTIQTPSLDDRIAAIGDIEKTRAQFVARQPMGRLGMPEEIAVLAVYLASDEAAFTTGATHIVDGGWVN